MLEDQTVDHVAQLARLELTDEERETFRSQLSKVLDYIDQLAEVDVDVEPGAPSARPGPPKLRLRDDEVTPSLPRRTALSNAPQAEAGFFRVPPLRES